VELHSCANYIDKKNENTKEGQSEAIKIIKAEALRKLIDKLKIDQALIFCRTRLDCDNLHRYLKRLDSGAQLIATAH
jgi:ATP-dependent RNA helicase DDX1